MDSNSNQKVNGFARRLGLMLIDNGMRIIQSSFHLDPIKVSGEEITQILRKYFPLNQITHLDSFYYLIPISQWKELIRVDWIDTKKWLEDRRDCDNFAEAFSANMSMFFEINSSGRVFGRLFTVSGDFVDYHYWTVLITAEKEIWFFEPKSDKLTETKFEGGRILIGTNEYKPVSFRFG